MLGFVAVLGSLQAKRRVTRCSDAAPTVPEDWLDEALLPSLPLGPVRQWAQELHVLWKTLCRKVRSC